MWGGSIFLIFLCASANAEWQSYNLQTAFASEWMEIQLLKAQLDYNLIDGRTVGYLSDITLHDKPIESFGFSFETPFTGQFQTTIDATKEQILIASGLSDLLGFVEPTTSRNSSMGLCQYNIERPVNNADHIRISTQSGDCTNQPMYIEGMSSMEAKSLIHRQSVHASLSKTSESFTLNVTEKISNNLGTINIRHTVARKGISGIIPDHIFSPQLYSVTENLDKMIPLVNENFCEEIKTFSKEIGKDLVGDMREMVRNQALEKFTMMIRNVHFAPTKSYILRECFLGLKEDLAETDEEIKKVTIALVTSAFVQAGSNDSLRFLNHLIDWEPSLLQPIDIVRIPDNVPSYLLTPSYIRYFFKLVIKSLDNQRMISAPVRGSLILSFSGIIRKAILENNLLPLAMDMKMSYLPFFNILNQDHQSEAKEELPLYFIRAFANLPLSKELDKFKDIYKHYENQLDMQIFVICALDKYASLFPTKAFRLLDEIFNDTEEEATRAAIFTQMMKTRVISVNRLKILSSQGSEDFSNTFQQQISACLSGKFGEDMTRKCSNAKVEVKERNAKVAANGLPFIVDMFVDTTKNVGFMTIHSQDLSEVMSKFSISLAVINRKNVIILETSYSQHLMDTRLYTTDSLGLDFLAISSNRHAVWFPTMSPFPYFFRSITPSISYIRTKIVENYLQISAIFSARNQTQQGVFDFSNKREHLLGLDTNIQVFLPQLNIKILDDGYMLEMADEKFLTSKRDARLLHTSSWPYAISRDIFHTKPTGQDVNNIVERVKRPMFSHVPSMTGIQEIADKLPTGLSFDAMISSEAPKNAALLINEGDCYKNIFNLWLNATRSTTTSVKLQFAGERDFTNLFLLKMTRGTTFDKSGLRSLSMRNWGMAENMKLSLTFNGTKPIVYQLNGNHASKSFLEVYTFRAKLTDGTEQKYEICGDSVYIMEPMKKVSFLGDLEYGQRCLTTNSTASVSMDLSFSALLALRDTPTDSEMDTLMSNAIVTHTNTARPLLEVFCLEYLRNATFVPPITCPTETKLSDLF